jgi:hypothetical protein
MNDYEKYVTEVNKIFSLLEKLKNSWTNNDNLSSIEDINEFKSAVIGGADYLDKISKKEGAK